MKVVVLGCTGLLGNRVMVELLRQGKHEVIGTSRRPKLAEKFFELMTKKKPVIVEKDFLREYVLERFLDSCKPDIIINCVGILKHNLKEEDYVDAIKLNALLPHRIAQWVEDEHSSHLMTFSSDCVFQGTQSKFYTPADEPDATDLYGRTKALGEVTHLYEATTIRTSFIGFEIEGHTSLLEWFINQAHQGNRVPGYWRADWNGVSTAFIARWICRNIQYPQGGDTLRVLHSQPTNKYTLLSLINEVLNLRAKIDKDFSFAPGKICHRLMSSETYKFDSEATWDGQLLADIADDYLIYQIWRSYDSLR